MNQLLTSLQEYTRLSVRYYKLKLAEKASDVFSLVVSWGLTLFLALCVLLFLSIFLSFYLNEVFGSNTLGFLLTAGLYLLLLVIALVFREKVLRSPVRDAFIKDLFKNE